MDAVLSHILDKSANRARNEELVTILKNNIEIVVSEIPRIDHALIELSPETHTIGFCYLL